MCNVVIVRTSFVDRPVSGGRVAALHRDLIQVGLGMQLDAIAGVVVGEYVDRAELCRMFTALPAACERAV